MTLTRTFVSTGGLHSALSRSSVCATVVCAFDWDQSACQVYDTNHGENIVRKVGFPLCASCSSPDQPQTDISALTVEQLVELRAELWLLSPSCQPYTVLNPLSKGSEDPRAKSFIHLFETILPGLVQRKRHPTYLLVENVAGFEVCERSYHCCVHL